MSEQTMFSNLIWFLLIYHFSLVPSNITACLATIFWSVSHMIGFQLAGTKIGKSVLIEDGGLPWIVQNANNEASPIRRHIELALCHLAQHGKIPYNILRLLDEKAERTRFMVNLKYSFSLLQRWMEGKWLMEVHCGNYFVYPGIVHGRI